MKIQYVLKLHSGDQVFWNDPDDGKCSRYYVIQTIEVNGNWVSIVGKDGSRLECWARELS